MFEYNRNLTAYWLKWGNFCPLSAIGSTMSNKNVTVYIQEFVVNVYSEWEFFGISTESTSK